MRIVLVRPRDPNNVGAAARAMANFDLEDLVVVAPHPPVWGEVRSAVGAVSVIERARVVATLAEAVADRVLVAGTTAGTRRRLGPVVGPEAFVAEAAAGGDDVWKRSALVFGNEKHGLTNDDLARCHRVVRIETSATQPSLNLSHSVAICSYEAWRGRGAGRASRAARPRGAVRATGEAIDALAEAVGVRVGKERGEKAAWRAEATMRRLLLRLDATASDLAFLRGLLSPRARDG